MLTTAIPTPTILIDGIEEVTGSNGRGIILLSSCGTPVRLALSRNCMMKLARMTTATAGELFADDGAEILRFPSKSRKTGRKAG